MAQINIDDFTGYTFDPSGETLTLVIDADGLFQDKNYFWGVLDFSGLANPTGSVSFNISYQGSTAEITIEYSTPGYWYFYVNDWNTFDDIILEITLDENLDGNARDGYINFVDENDETIGDTYQLYQEAIQTGDIVRNLYRNGNSIKKMYRNGELIYLKLVPPSNE